MSTTADMTAGTATQAPADTALTAANRRVGDHVRAFLNGG